MTRSNSVGETTYTVSPPTASSETQLKVLVFKWGGLAYELNAWNFNSAGEENELKHTAFNWANLEYELKT